MIHFTLDDTACWSKSVLSAYSETTNEVGYFDPIKNNYFRDLIELGDVRDTRLLIFDNILTGKMTLSFDKYTLDSELSNILFPTSLTEKEYISTVLDIESKAIYNIVEYSMYTQGITVDDINTNLLADTTNFADYVDGSFDRSTHVSLVKGNNIPDWISFSTKFGESVQTFKVWLNRLAFKNDYPITVISEVVPPCNVNTLLDLSFSNSTEAIINSTATVAQGIQTCLSTYDNTGVKLYYTKHSNMSFGQNYEIPFGVVYKGKEPSSLQLREAIRNFLVDSHVADEDTWKFIFPDLYVKSQFFLVPVWDNFTILPDKTLYPSILNLDGLRENIVSLVPHVDSTYASTHVEIIQASSSEMFICGIGDPNNDGTEFIKEEHRSYCAYDATNTSFKNQETHTREFNIKLSKCLTILMGGINNGEFVENTFGDKNYLSFTTNFIEYHLMFKESYLGV